MSRARIWELDALRGAAILGVVFIHLLYDLQTVWGMAVLQGGVLGAVRDYGGTVFVVLSGLCATLGSRSLRRGAAVFAAGMAVTGVTAAMVRLGLAPGQVLIRFGVLHLLGTCMLLWPLLRPLPWWGLAVCGGAVIAAGAWFSGLTVQTPWLFPLGLCRGDFYSGDYFPLFPYLGWFLLGGALGKTLYREKQSLLPRTWQVAPVRFLCLCGRKSLSIYLLHQPVLYTAITAASLI